MIESQLHIGLLRAAIKLANDLLSLDTPYQLAVGAEATGAQVPVFLVAGDGLGSNEYSFALARERCIVVNADRLVALIGLVGGEYSNTEVVDPQPQFGLFPPRQDYARKALALILMHEVGHIWQTDHPDSRYSGLPSPFYERLVKLAGTSRAVELEADKFCADRLRLAHEKQLEYNRNPREFIKKRAIPGHTMRSISDFENFAFQTVTRVPLRKPFTGQTPVSHLDFDIRAYLYWRLGPYAVGANETEQDVLDFELPERFAQDSFKRAWDEVVMNDPVKLKADRYYPYKVLLKSRDPAIRWQTAVALRREEPLPDDMIPVLIDALKEKYGETRAITYTCSSLGHRAVPALIECLRDTNPLIRYHAALCLAQMGPVENKDAVPALRKAADDPDEWTRKTARAALARHDANGK
jgi:hypothetical protein